MKELVSKIDALMCEFRIEAEKNVTGNKSAGVRARKITLQIAEMMKDYRKKSIESDK